ncbi:NAD(P)H-binding protein [Hymenobacter lutimineralis]|uniref:NAD(P)H-binding protein n=1 Tax=Hymenobacter lutimineralis TaxID=2606448 RepID=A0A5D6VGQ5_9BACT|nr:NAD(P)H-binding protein [Hymenobacter lutimineralis]TYZ14550.1 NAD(P)H-binding protein [Hymenobacter lutimineralis]
MTSSSSSPTLAVLGCGWLGLPLAQALVAAGYAVRGSTTSPDKLPTLAAAGIQPTLLQLTPELSDDDPALAALLSGTETLVLNVPPRASSGIPYLAVLRPVAAAVQRHGVRQVLFVSSTGVYPDVNQPLTEADALASAEATSPLLQAEYLFATLPGVRATVVRMAGLIGPGRPPGRFLAGRQAVAQGSAPVNLIHLTDCVGTLLSILQQQLWGFTLNASAAQHPLRREFYPVAARFLGLEPPTFLPEEAGGKTIDSTQLRQLTGYSFQHDDLLAALAYC